LASEVEVLRRSIHTLSELPGRVEQLGATVAAAEAVPVIAHWWGCRRDQTAPVPDAQLIDAAQARRASVGRGGQR
jgi:hypothetical protein